jgi:TonB family protein
MSPVSLLFSSDEETSSRLVQALTELELEVVPCPDVFTAVEWLTSRSFDVIVADWDSGPEAPFLLKNARELKLNKAAFTLAVTSGKTNVAAEAEDSPDLILTKPLASDQIKYAVLSNDRFLGCMKAWIARGDFAQGRRTTPSVLNEQRRPQSEQPSPISPTARPVEPSPTNDYPGGAGAPLHLTFATLDRGLFRSIHQPGPEHQSGKVKRYRANKYLWGTFLSVVFVAVGCTFGEPLRVQSVFASVATAYEQALEKSKRREPSESGMDASSSALAQAISPEHLRSGRYSPSRLRTAPLQPMSAVEEGPTSAVETLQADVRLDRDRLPMTELRVLIPESLKVTQAEAATVRPVSVKRPPSLLSQLEPVNLPEDLSQGLLLQKVPPSYPEQALKAGLQGAVVLQAWIDKDGSIRDLKLVNGSLLLGQAAVKAVKQWRYKPYLRNGVAVEAETYVTVNFKLP